MTSPLVGESMTYPVRQTINFESGQLIEGCFVYADGGYPHHFLNALESIDSISEEGIISILPSETNYTSAEGLNLLPQIINSNVAISELITFGASGMQHKGLSHLDIVVRELGVPFCVAERPREYMHRSRELTWLHLQRARFSPLHGRIGQVTLAADSSVVTLASSQTK